jgi:hypothetical protein
MLSVRKNPVQSQLIVHPTCVSPSGIGLDFLPAITNKLAGYRDVIRMYCNLQILRSLSIP